MQAHPITKPAIIRLIKDASFEGIQISGLVYEEIRGKLQKHLVHIIDASLIYMAHAKQKTLSYENVVSALPEQPILNVENKKSIKTCKKSARKKEACFYFPKQAFRHFVLSLTGDNPIRISSDALAVLQIECEHFLVKLVRQAVDLMRHAGRTTMQPKDLSVATNIATSCSQKGVVNMSSSKMVSLTSSNFNTILNAVGQALINKAEFLATKSTIASRDVETAVRLVLPGDLATFAIKNVAKIKHKLLFSVESVGELFRKNTGLFVSENATVYLTAVLEYMEAELESGDDEEINELYKNLGFFIGFRK